MQSGYGRGGKDSNFESNMLSQFDSRQRRQKHNLLLYLLDLLALALGLSQLSHKVLGVIHALPWVVPVSGLWPPQAEGIDKVKRLALGIVV